MPGVAECALKRNKLIYVDIRGYQDPNASTLGHLWVGGQGDAGAYEREILVQMSLHDQADYGRGLHDPVAGHILTKQLLGLP